MAFKKKDLFPLANEENLELLMRFRRSLYAQGLKEVTIYNYSKNIYGYMVYLQDDNINTLESSHEDFSKFIVSLEVKEKRVLGLYSSIFKAFEFWKARCKLIDKNPLDLFDTRPYRAKLNTDRIKK